MMDCYKCNSLLQGSIQYGLHTQCFLEWFELEQSEEFSTVTPKNAGSQSSSPQKFDQLNSSFFHGKFKKYSANLGTHSYILKVQEAEYPELPATEYLSNQIAREFGLKIPEFYLIDFYGAPAFVSKNFIRKDRGENLVHIYRYLEDAEFDCKSLINVIARETGRQTEVERFIELCLFDALIGNHDRHGRNLAIIESKSNKVLAPFYDNPSYVGIETQSLLAADLSPRGKIATSMTGEPQIKDYLKEFTKLGYGDTVSNFVNKLSLDNINAAIDQSFISTQRKKSFKRLIAKNAKDL